MNTTQIQTTLAPIVAFIAGILAGKGVFGWDSQTWITVIGGILGVVGTVWAAVVTRKTAQVASVAAMPEVAAVVTTKTAAGNVMSGSGSPENVVPAGTTQAAALAK